MAAPILYEVNTRAWLRDLSARAGRTLTLADVPDGEIQRWQALGFTHIWLMGVWQIGPKAREHALQDWRSKWCHEIDSVEEDVTGSPFAIQEYAVDSRLGEPISLLLLKERLGAAGMKLILDFVPNHVGLDSTDPIRFPARFVQAPEGSRGSPGTVELETKLGRRVFANGRDPFFPPWTDTIQVDYRVRETQEAMVATAQTASMFGDGLRCDMAMLLLPEIFEQTWRDFPPSGANQTASNFWTKAIPAIRQLQPQVELIAEVYWDQEEELQNLGFDYTYNKRLGDMILRRQLGELQKYLSNAPLDYLSRSVHFLENHDERRAAAELPPALHAAAAALILFLPGMALLHDGQLEGRKKFARIQITKRPAEEPDAEIAAAYENLLGAVANSHVRSGKPVFVEAPEEGVVAVGWQGADGALDLAVVNLGGNSKEMVLPKKLLPRLNTQPVVIFSTGNGLKTVSQPGDGSTIRVPLESAQIIRFGA